MIDPPPNGYEIAILLDELGWTYRVLPVNGRGGQCALAFATISPNNKIPALVRPHKWWGQKLDELTGLRQWYEIISEWPVVRRGLGSLSDRLAYDRTKPAGRAWKTLFANRPAVN